MASDGFHAVYRPPHPKLAKFVRGYWEIKGHPGSPREKILPREEIVLIVNLGDPQLLLDGSGLIRERLSEAWISGLQRRPLFVEASGCNWLCGACLSSEGALQLLGQVTKELTGEVVALRDVLPNWANYLFSALKSARAPSERFDRLDEALGQMLRPPTGRESSVAWIAAALREGLHDRVSALADDLGWSRQRVHKRFQTGLGLSPKAFGRLVRFDRALKLVHDGGTPLAQIAQDCGYFDQAHFTREFRAFSDESPRSYTAAAVGVDDHGFVNLNSLDEN